MARDACLMLQTLDTWRLIALGSSEEREVTVEDCDPAEIAEEVSSFVSDAKLSARRIVVALHAQRVLTGDFALPAEHRPTRRMLSYELENHLPWSAEEIAADFQLGPQRCFGAAIELDKFLPLARALEDRQLRIQSIAPAAVLAVQQMDAEVGLAGFDMLLWEDAGRCEFMQLAEGRIQKWHSLGASADTVSGEVAFAVLEGREHLRALLVNVGPEIRSALSEQAETESIASDSMEEFTRRASNAVVDGDRSAWIEFRRGALTGGDPWLAYRSELNWFAAALAAFLIAATAASWAKISSNGRQIEEHRQRQEAHFREAIPAAQIPVGIVSRMRSEQTNLVGAHAAGNRLALPTPALNVLLAFLRGIPSLEGCLIREVDIYDGRLDLEAELPSISNANVLAAALRREGFSIDAPTTTQAGDDVVTARIYGELSDGALETGAGPKPDDEMDEVLE